MSYKLLSNGQWWIINRTIAQEVGIEASLLLAELVDKFLYFESRGELKEKEGVFYFFYTSKEIQRNTTLSYTLQKKNIKLLENKGFITTSLMGVPAKLHFTIVENKISEFLKTGFDQNSKLYINTRIINTRDKKEKEKEKSPKTSFCPPSLEEIKEYIAEKNFSVNADSFLNFYQSKGWLVGKVKMKDWKAAIRTWQQREKPQKQAQKKQHGSNWD